jgi:RNA polymerase sigma-70 factor (ECF subfamily)
MMNTPSMQSHSQEIWETTRERLFRAGEYVSPGEYVEVETTRRLTLEAPDFLPARLDGHVACYRAVRCGGKTPEEPTLRLRQEQFQQLVARVQQRLYNFAYRSLGNSQDAEDATQETLARAWGHFEEFDLRHPFEAWVFRIARNLMIDQCRRRRRRQEISLDAPAAYLEGDENKTLELSDSSGDPQNCFMAGEISDELRSALGSLAPVYQVPLLLRAEQRSYEQIARALNCPVGTVRSRIYRARVLLRSTLKESKFHE